MKINSIQSHNFRNSEHFQFQTEFRDLVTEFGSDALKIKPLFDKYLPLYAAEDEAFLTIKKSAATNDIEAADHVRDLTFRGLADSVKAAQKHFSIEVREAATRLKIVFDTYGNLAQKPLNEETAAITNLLQELNGQRTADIATLGINAWLTELDNNNKAFEALVKARNDEASRKTELKMKEARTAVDTSYSGIVEKINALIVVQGEENYASFVKKLNLFIEKYNNTVAQRRGTAAKKNEELKMKNEE